MGQGFGVKGAVADYGHSWAHYGVYTVHGTRYMVHSTWYTVYGTRYMVHGTWYTVHGARNMVHGTWYKVVGPRDTLSSVVVCSHNSFTHGGRNEVARHAMPA